MRDATSIAYCGPAPLPAELLTRWNLDPLLLIGLAAFALFLVNGRSANARAGWAAWALMVLVFVSPLCALSAALFSARVLHHVLLVAIVAPLLALALPARKWPSPPLGLLVALAAVVLWTWHMPAPYAWGLATVPGYWLMQGSLLGSAWLLWRAVFAPATTVGAALVALVATVAQMGLLAALIVFASRPLYAAHVLTAPLWGMDALADQQLAGLLMWVPGSLPYLAVGLWLAWSSLRPAGTTA